MMRIINRENITLPPSAVAIIDEAERAGWHIALVFKDDPRKTYPLIDFEDAPSSIGLSVVTVPDYQTQTIHYGHSDSTYVEIGPNKPLVSVSQAIRIAQAIENVSHWPLRREANNVA